MSGTKPNAGSGSQGFERYTASLIVEYGAGIREVHVVESPHWLVECGPDVDAAFSDAETGRGSMSVSMRPAIQT